MKKKIAILISGEIRSNSLGGGKNHSFVETFNKNVLNKDVLNHYDVNIFFVTDKINEKLAYDYFGENLKGLLQLSFQDIDNPLPLDIYIHNYLQYHNYRKMYPQVFPIVTHSREQQVYKFYKLYAAYTLMKKYEQIQFIHDYILCIRPDTSINDSL